MAVVQSGFVSMVAVGDVNFFIGHRGRNCVYCSVVGHGPQPVLNRIHRAIYVGRLFADGGEGGCNYVVGVGVEGEDGREITARCLH